MTAAGPPRRAPFPRDLLAGDVDTAARHLLGALIVREPTTPVGPRRVGRIVEVEAYGGPEDAASHARFAGSSRRAAMAAAPGSAYVYLVYGMHSCLNVVAGPVGHPTAVLVRAVRPLEGTEAIRAARASGARDPASGARIARLDAQRLAAGPALVAAAFDVDRSLTGADLCDPLAPLRLEVEVDAAGQPVEGDPARIRTSPRVGVAYAGEPWASTPRRLYLADEPAVSGRRG